MRGVYERRYVYDIGFHLSWDQRVKGRTREREREKEREKAECVEMRGRGGRQGGAQGAHLVEELGSSVEERGALLVGDAAALEDEVEVDGAGGIHVLLGDLLALATEVVRLQLLVRVGC